MLLLDASSPMGNLKECHSLDIMNMFILIVLCKLNSSPFKVPEGEEVILWVVFLFYF